MKVLDLNTLRQPLFFIYSLVYFCLLLSLEPSRIDVCEYVFVFLEFDEVIVSGFVYFYFERLFLNYLSFLSLILFLACLHRLLQQSILIIFGFFFLSIGEHLLSLFLVNCANTMWRLPCICEERLFSELFSFCFDFRAPNQQIFQT